MSLHPETCLFTNHSDSNACIMETYLCFPLFSIPFSACHRIGDNLWFVWLQCKTCRTSRDSSYTILCLEFYPMCSKSKRNDNTDQVTHFNQWLGQLCPSVLAYDNFVYSYIIWERFCVRYTESFPYYIGVILRRGTQITPI